MGPSNQETHRPGALKQQNKTHKTGRHKSKGAIDKAAKGKVAPKVLTSRARRELRRNERRNQANQIRHRKRDEVLAIKRQIGSAGRPPILVAIVPLSQNADPYLAMEKLRDSDEDTKISYSKEGYLHLSVPRLRQRFSLVIPTPGELYSTLDVLKVADTVLFVMSATEEGLDEDAETLLSAAFAQGLPTPVVASTDIADLSIKKRNEVKQSLQRVLSRWLPEERLASLETTSDAQVLLRRLGSQKKRMVAQRDNRAHLLADVVEFTPGDEAGVGTLKVSGFVRGQPLSVNGLVHIPGWGDFQLLQTDAPEDPHPLLLGTARRVFVNDTGMEEEASTRVLEVANPEIQESLTTENVPDPMDAEQTWPTEEELADAARARSRTLVKRVPKGTSEYQAAWIPDSDAESAEDSMDDEEEEEEEGVFPTGVYDDEESQCGDLEAEDLESMVTMSEAPDTARYDQDLDLDEEQKALATIKGARMDEMYPDEVDTPQDVPARIRFQKYRGLKSFRTSTWDPKEDLPHDYARIFQFQNFAHTRKRILKNEDREGALLGWYVTVHVARVPQQLVSSRQPGHPLVLFGLLPHEQKMSVVNVALRRCPGPQQMPIKAKEPLVFHIGFRRFRVNPVFSQHTNGNKHKYERYFHTEKTVVATFFAPIIFPPASALVFKENTDGSQLLVATGSIMSVDPDRIIVKRTVLSGHPFKVNRKSAVVRFLFFNREDILWFKPLELRTKYGRRGHMKEPLGTHGHVKCVFDGQIKSQDTILLHLFKRVFPKWNYDPQVSNHLPSDSVQVSELTS